MIVIWTMGMRNARDLIGQAKPYQSRDKKNNESMMMIAQKLLQFTEQLAIGNGKHYVAMNNHCGEVIRRRSRLACDDRL